MTYSISYYVQCPSYNMSIFKPCVSIYISFHPSTYHLPFIEGSLEVKLPTIWTDEKQRWEESEQRREEKRRRKKIKKRREEKRREEKRREEPRLPRKVKVDVTECHACHAKSRGVHGVIWEPSAPPEPAQCHQCRACHAK